MFSTLANFTIINNAEKSPLPYSKLLIVKDDETEGNAMMHGWKRTVCVVGIVGISCVLSGSQCELREQQKTLLLELQKAEAKAAVNLIAAGNIDAYGPIKLNFVNTLTQATKVLFWLFPF